MDIRQSEMYAEYMRRIGWMVENADGTQIFIKRFPLIGSFIKIQRPEKMPSMKLIDEMAQKYGAWSISIEAISSPPGSPFGHPGGVLEDFRVNQTPYLPTKTIRIDLTVSEDEIFQRFTEAKRRAVRKAVKSGVVVKESNNIKEFIKLKSEDFWPLGFFMSKDVRALWESFRTENASAVVACQAHPRGVHSATPGVSSGIAGILLLFYDSIAYYWMAASTNEGKRLFAPALLVWEGLKLAKKKGCTVFDFEGIYDERFHNATKKWGGFTKFKQGFGGKEINFPKPLIKKHFIF